MVPILAIAGSLGRKQRIPASAGTLPTGTPLFALMLAGIAVLIVGLTYFPVLALVPSSSTSSESSEKESDDIHPRSPGRSPAGDRGGTNQAAFRHLQQRHGPSGMVDSLVKLSPRHMKSNPVMFVVELGSVLTTFYLIRDFGSSRARRTSSPSASWSGSGSPSSSPTSPRRWPRAAARPRPTHCARRVPRPSPTCNAVTTPSRCVQPAPARRPVRGDTRTAHPG